MQLYVLRRMMRIDDFNRSVYFKGLFNQYSVDMAAKMISERHEFIKRNQTCVHVLHKWAIKRKNNFSIRTSSS